MRYTRASSRMKLLIRAFLDRAVAVTRRLAAEKRFQRAPILLSGAGSAWYDVVADVFTAASFRQMQSRLSCRPGCYLTHDVGMYREAQTKIMQRNPIANQMRTGLYRRSRSGRMCNPCQSRARRSSLWVSATPHSTPDCQCQRCITGRETPCQERHLLTGR